MNEVILIAEEIKARKAILIESISNLLSDFTDSTGMVVTAINIKIITKMVQKHIGYIVSITIEI